MSLPIKSIAINGKKVSYIDEGSGEVILLIHGWPTCKEVLLPLIGELKNNFRVVACDLPGFGDSESIEEYAGLDFYADFLRNFLEELELNNVNIFGNSIGGGLALLMGQKYPEKVKRLFVMAPLFYYKQLPRIFSGRFTKRLWRYFSKFSLCQRVLGQVIYLIYFKIRYPQEVREGKGYSFNKRDILQVVISKFRLLENLKPIRDIVISCLEVDYRPMLEKMNFPTLILWNRNEKLLSSKWAEVLHKLLPDSKLTFIKDSPHSVLASDEKVIAKRICNFMLTSDKIGS